jgi:hypothetical protein
MQRPDRPPSPEENRRVTRAAALRPLNLLTLAVGVGFFALTLLWWVIPLTLIVYAAVVFLNARDPVFRSRTLTGRTPPPPLPDGNAVSPERRARWLARGETRDTVERALDVARRVISAIEDADEVTRAVLDDAVPRVEAASERLVTVAENREKALAAISDLRAAGRQGDGVQELEDEVEASETEISNTLELLLTLRARVVRVSMDSGPEARAAAEELNASLDGLNLRLEALSETMRSPEDPPRDGP